MILDIKDIYLLKDILLLQNISGNEKFSGVSIDSRTIKKRQIFFAIKGENFNGHDYILNAIAKGSSLIVIEEKWYKKNKLLVEMYPIMVVEDSIKTYGDLAKIFRRKFAKPIIGLTGSNGKTTTKEMIAKVLSEKYNVLKTKGNLNNNIGVPQMIFGMNEKYDLAVIEMGTNHFGEIKYLCDILDPDYGLITNVGKAHLEFFKNLSGVRKAKGELFNYLSKNNKFGFINADDRNINEASKILKNKKLYGFNGKYDYTGKYLGINKNLLSEFIVSYNKNKNFILRLRIPGEHNLINALAAAVVGLEFEVSENEIQKALYSFKPADKRMQIEKRNGITILNDCYNSNPDSVKAALKTAMNFPNKNKKIVVLGDMLELGDAKKLEHQSVGNLILNSGFDLVFLYGQLSKFTFDIVKNKIKYAFHFKEKTELVNKLNSLSEKGDLILVKGSRGMKMESIVENILLY